MGHMFFIIPCGAGKLPHRAPAATLYTGGQFRYALERVSAEAALTTTAYAIPTTVLIMSALHGLVTLDTELDPYNVKMGDPGSITPDQLRTQALDHGIDYGVEVYAFLPKAYLRTLDTALRTLDVYAQDVYEAAPGIGYQRGVLSHAGRPIPAAA